MSGHGAAACRVAHNGPPQWDIPLTDERHRLVRWDLVRIGSVNPGFSTCLYPDHG